MKKLTKCKSNKMLCGVCSGVANYFGIDPTIVRLIWAFLVVGGGIGLLAYIICAIVMPDEETSIM